MVDWGHERCSLHGFVLEPDIVVTSDLFDDLRRVQNNSEIIVGVSSVPLKSSARVIGCSDSFVNDRSTDNVK